MKTKFKKSARSFFISLLSVLLLFLFATNSFAVDVKGFAVYRQGNAPNPSGHAGLVCRNGVDASDSIIHVLSGTEYWVRKTSLNTFIDNQDFYGYYVPKTLKNFTAADREKRLSDAISLAESLSRIHEDFLGYNALYQVWYTEDKNNNGIVDYNEIKSIRCDGLVEYCYEYNGFSVYPGNISKFDFSIRDAHSAPNVTPKQQIKHYLQNCLGDVDGNAKVDSADSRLVLRVASKLETFDTYQNFVGDVDGDKKVNSSDARLIERYAAKLETSFPADPFPS